MPDGSADGGRQSRSVVIMGLHYAPEHSGNAPYTTGIARHLARSGFDVEAIVGYPHYPEWRLHRGYRRRRPREIDEGVRLRRLRHPVPARPTAAARILMESVYAAGASLQLLRMRPDVVIAVSPVLLSLVPAVLLRALRGYRLGVVTQDLYGAALAETGLGGGALARATARLEIALLKRADSVVVIHDVFRKRLIASGVPEESIRVIPNWVHVSVPARVDVGATRTRLGWGVDEVIALHAGNMGVKQGLEGLVETARLAAERGSRVRVVLLGDGSQRGRLQALGAGLSNLTFQEPLPSGVFESALSAADVLLLHEKPGVLEMSVPSKLTSYFSAGRPIVAATDPRSGAAAMIGASGGGVISEAGNPQSILGRIEEVASDAGAAEAMGAAGRTFAREALSDTDALGRYAEWVQQLLKRRGV